MKRKSIIITGIILLMMTTGCNGAQQANPVNISAETLQSPYSAPGNLAADDAAPTDSNDTEADSPTNSSSADSGNAADLPAPSPEHDSTPETDTPQKLDLGNPDAVFIGGTVRSVSQDSFVISQTLIEDSVVTMPEPGSPDEVLVTVHCSASTVYELWTIEGGGAGITKADAAFSDIQVGGGLEAFGIFDGEEFIADKVIIELYK